MSDLISLVMEAAASELLHQEVSQVDQEMEDLLTEIALVPSVEGRLADFTQRFFTLLKRRGDIAQRALGLHEGDFFTIFEPSAGLDAEHHTHVRVSADQTEDQRCREMLKQLADIYQELAEQAEQANNAPRRDRERERENSQAIETLKSPPLFLRTFKSPPK